MPINTKMAKSGLKKVHKKKTTAVGGRQNRAARQINTAEADELTRGVAGLRDPVNKRGNRLASKKQDVIRGNRRRH